MKDLRRAYLLAWDQAEQHGGDFKDCLLHYLSCTLGMPVLNDVSKREPTDEGIEEMTPEHPTPETVARYLLADWATFRAEGTRIHAVVGDKEGFISAIAQAIRDAEAKAFNAAYENAARIIETEAQMQMEQRSLNEVVVLRKMADVIHALAQARRDQG